MVAEMEEFPDRDRIQSSFGSAAVSLEARAPEIQEPRALNRGSLSS